MTHPLFSLSAAAQAVTTYLRAHKARCDKQEDHPLLLSHTLSGTPADDDLLPALFSRSGGDSHHLQHRLTNFRKGTAVWYLSRATGVPCPFSRAGIRLCDYVTAPDPPDLPQPKRELEICGQKRKRPLRGCRGTNPSGSENERPPKVKLTLRLKPLMRPLGSTSTRPIPVSDSEVGDSDDDSMSVVSSDDQSHTKEEEKPWSLPPYPRRSISIPCYTPSVDAFYPCYPPSPSRYKDPFRRSPSLATPPPDSEDEADDFHVAMTRIKHYPEQEDDIGWDADLDSEGEGDTVWESPGPRSPSAPLLHPSDVAVKEEPRDVQGMLDAWEDFDTSIAGARVAEVLARALDSQKVKQEEELIDPWDWQATSEDNTCIKQEDFGVDSLFPLSSSPPATEPDSRTIRPRAKTVPAPSPFSPNSLPPRQSVSSASSREPAMPSTALVTLLQSMSVNTNMPSTSFALPPPTPCVSPLQTRCQPSSTLPAVVVSTCQPCTPIISATQIEGRFPIVLLEPKTYTFLLIDISVYQMMLGAFQLLRRIDTDFVNLSPIAAYSAAPLHPSTIPNATVVTKGSPEVCGTWVPLAAAQAYVREHISGKAAQGLEVFLSETLVERFPQALQDFHRSAVVRGLNQFGRHFNSTLQAADWEVQTEGGASPAPYHQHAVSALASSYMPGLGAPEKVVDAPLSATEQELFHELCVIPDWDKENVAEVVEAEDAMVVDTQPPPPTPKLSIVTPVVTISPIESPLTSPESPAFPTISTDSRPLRRSKRVASVLAAHHSSPSRARSRKGGSRNSLS